MNTHCISRRSRIFAAPLFICCALFAGCEHNDAYVQGEKTNLAWSEVINQYHHSNPVLSSINTAKGYAAQEKDIVMRVNETFTKDMVVFVVFPSVAVGLVLIIVGDFSLWVTAIIGIIIGGIVGAISLSGVILGSIIGIIVAFAAGIVGKILENKNKGDNSSESDTRCRSSSS
jgi:hypothetical protein